MRQMHRTFEYHFYTHKIIQNLGDDLATMYVRFLRSNMYLSNTYPTLTKYLGAVKGALGTVKPFYSDLHMYLSTTTCRRARYVS